MTFRFLPLLVAFLLAASPLLAQTTPATAQPALPVAAPAALVPDTAAALHRLFAAKRRKLTYMLIGTGTAELAGQAVVGTTVRSGGIIDDQAIARLFVAVLTVPVAVAEVLFYAQYNQKHEERALENFPLHRLSRHLRRQLKAKYFHQARLPNGRATTVCPDLFAPYFC